MKILAKHCLNGILCLLLVCMVLTLGFRSLVEAGEYDEATSGIEEADKVICKAFEAVLDAEGAGANVSSLIANLNEAGDLFVQAKIRYSQGDAGKAIELAGRASAIAEKVRVDAVELKGWASEDKRMVFQLTFACSLAGVLAFLIALVLVWGRFKRFYISRVLKSRPEVD